MIRYVRLAIGWVGLLVASAAMVALFALASAAPQRLGGLIVVCLIVLAIALALLFDEQAIAVVHVAPRTAAWRFGARTLAAAVPALGWGIGVWVLSARLDSLNRGGWWLVGLGVGIAVCGAASALVRRGSATPGAAVAGATVLLVTAPLIPLPFQFPVAVYPVGTFPGDSVRLWLSVLAAGAVALAVGLRDTPHR